MYTELSRNRVNEPNRGQNYSEFYFTTYIVAEYSGEQKEFSFYEQSEEEIELEIKKYFNIV
jgi:hypothetical protein